MKKPSFSRAHLGSGVHRLKMLGGALPGLLILYFLGGCQLPQVVQEPVSSAPPMHSVGYGLVETPSILKASQRADTPGFLKFSHQVHVSEQEMECSACHEISEAGKPAMPDHEACSTCHDINTDEPSDACMMCHILEPQAIQTQAWGDVAVIHPKKVDEFQFNHTAFAGDSTQCASCHKNAASSKQVTDNVGGTHATLFSEVRKAGGNPDNCALCHTKISRQNPPDWHRRPDFGQTHGKETQRINEGVCLDCHTQNQCQSCHQQTKPQSHLRPEWAHSHGKVGTFDEKACLLCHSEQACKTCHQSQMPRDHTNFFRRRSHGKMASWNRDRCLVCHKQDYCEACHVGAAPLVTKQPFHTPGAPCLNCHSPASPVRPLRRHGPLPEDTCMKCHRIQ
ncbi:MAG: hypothetical protein KJ050_08905 [Candidatus Omnitrophica bacterium]|nr:hypothetical protein [Candidatus Omnitrophota bacterium]MBV6482199.1 hypothetical protein [bacterium]MCL4735043.1 hypothetical protein [Candidatus Omnitrophota bacterium]